VRPERLREDWSRDRIIDALRDRGIPSFQGSCPEIYLEKAFDGTGWRPEPRLPVARELGETSLAFLVHPTLTEPEVATMQQALVDVLSEASQRGNAASTGSDEGSARG
jgi:dTDP-4-amino-4,6-dideoxygalactose transaminase